ncbi:MAG: antitoxin [Elusimicrobia bacterium RIFOXYD12_FULL_66_9]|nr:MAG: antitoxin [Elusimicrobia bacterium RIFOXYD12_FULL_66_9]
MRDHYDFSKMKSVRNPYYRHLTKPITIRIENGSLVYFKQLAEEYEIPYQRLINMYLRDCAQQHKKLRIRWAT